MMKGIIFLALFFKCSFGNAQSERTSNSALEQQLESAAMQNESVETEDDQYMQQMQHFLKHPLDLNSVGEDEFSELKILTPFQVQQFFSYRDLLGKFIDIYELQAIPGWDVPTILKLRPYIVIKNHDPLRKTITDRLRLGEHSILLRASQVLERSKGFLQDSSAAANFYRGSPQKILIRYRYAYKNLFQYGVIAEKDAGEQFFKGKQKLGFDFYSFHVFVRKAGIVRDLAIGDFTVNMGQGLIQWQGLAFKKGADALAVKRESPVLRPYNSAGEINFHRGFGITLSKRKWETTLFASYRKLDANLVRDTFGNLTDHVSSFQTSGYHRTQGEAEDKGIQRQLAFGANFSISHRHWKMGVNSVAYFFSLPLLKKPEPYNKYSLSGKSFGNCSFDYSYTFRNIHFFGELAFTSSFKKAVLTGIIASVSSKLDMALLYRYLEPAYQSLYASTFSEGAYASNEKGIYLGVTIRPSTIIRIDTYADLFKFPWLRYQVDRPSYGSDYFIQFSYMPNRRLELYTRYHHESKAINSSSITGLSLPIVTKQPRQNWRFHVNYQANRDLQLRNRVEICWFDKNGEDESQGSLYFLDILFKPALKPYSGGLRIQYFETDNYDSRLYAYENDVLYSYSTPVFYEKGLRYYINVSYDLTKKLTFWAKWSQTIYPGKSHIGSGLDEISKWHKSEFRFQALYTF